MFHFIKKIGPSISLFRAAFYKHKRMIAVLTILGFVSGLLGGVGISTVVPLFSFVGDGGGAGVDPISTIFRRVFNAFGFEFSLPIVITLLVSVFVGKGVFLYIASVINARASTTYEAETRRELLQYTMRASWPYLLDRKIGHISQMITDDVNRAGIILTSLSSVILFATSFVAYACVAVGISLPVTLVTIGIGGVLFFILKPLFFHVRKLSREAAHINKDAAHHISQYIVGAKTVKAMAVEQSVLVEGNAYFSELARSKYQVAKYTQVLSTFLEPLTLAVVIPIFLMSYKDPSFNLASFAAILYLVQKMFSFAQSIQIKISIINQSIPHLIAVVQYQSEARAHKEQSGGLEGELFHSDIVFKDVSFGYENDGEAVLQGFNFRIHRGETVGLIGRSGAGKTTIGDMLLGLFRPQSGAVSVDGVDMSHISLAAWRRCVGYVSQDIFLLNGTIEQNIKFFDDSISKEDMVRAAQLAHIYDFIVHQPEQFDTIIGERGMKLSAGQRQRIVLARVLARRPKLLVLDEATSALDNESELFIRDALRALRGSVTMLIIAHRLSTIKDADRLIVLGEGHVIEEGIPTQLLKDKDSKFYQMYNIRET